MELEVVKHTEFFGENIRKVAVCGGSGSFLINAAKSVQADVYITSDIKYHEFFAAEKQLMICDIGHFESEKYTIDLFSEILSKKFPNFATIFAQTNTQTNTYFAEVEQWHSIRIAELKQPLPHVLNSFPIQAFFLQVLLSSSYIIK